jgi:hypothetical protein
MSNLTSGGMDSGAEPILDWHVFEVEKKRVRWGFENAGSRNDGIVLLKG